MVSQIITKYIYRFVTSYGYITWCVKYVDEAYYNFEKYKTMFFVIECCVTMGKMNW